ncbi:ShlB/FhaC/HecB family hemolysin secretion/activation protein [Xenophilus arseniciresistens]|uniref:ShlB/FhaC/HecB family hemolysin secretion/activation protein n=1 Tax=Xenophilus arseniciresistens TaxID=1283306 RepID=A0AAE3NBR2_9BURK|nr:POTRA domain-containing protein [Xenophilus arseniciresistens]MDA7417402.1 ShlB/FhaC/HecB family hemolysin secretion/activation protein [Xenophilus arseniciresistens]
MPAQAGLHWLRSGLNAMLAGALAAAAQAQSSGNPLDQLPLPAQQQQPPVPRPQVALQQPAGAAGRLGESVTPTRFDIEGVSAIPFAEVAALFAPWVGQPVLVERLVQAARQASALYSARGHPLAFVYLPEQSFADGVVRVVAVEGYIASVRIEGDAGPGEERLRAMAATLQAERPLRQASFERVSQLMARLPGLNVKATAALPASTDGATTLVLHVKRQPHDLSLGADLRQPRPRAVLTGVLNDPLTAGGQLSASTLLGHPRQEALLTTSYSQLVGADGTALKASFTHYRGYPDENMERGARIERRNTNRRAEFSASHPLLLDARRSLTLSGGLYAVNNLDAYSVPLTGTRLDDDTRVRAVFAQLGYQGGDASRARSANLMLAQGLRGLGATAQQRSNVRGAAGVNPARLDFTRLSLEASQRDRFENQWGSALSLGAQYSPHSLAASERISFGGQRFGRGYSAGDAAGDSGWGVGAELNRLFKVDGGEWLRQVEPYLLLEAAQVSLKKGWPAPRRLRSVALGTRLSDGRHYHLDLAVAKPVGDASATNPLRRARLTLLLNYNFGER